MLRSICRLSLLCLLSLLLFAPGATAEVETSYSLDLISAYVWRGITFTDGLVFQPSITSSHSSGFSFNFWGNLDIDDVNGLDGEFQEIDLTLAYAFPTEGKVGVEVGFIEYLFPNLVGLGTREIYVSLGFDAPLSPAITVYYDFDEVDDYYATVEIGHSTDLGNDTSLDIGLLVANAGDTFARTYGGTTGGLYNGQATIGISHETASGWSVAGFVAYSDTLDKKVLPTQLVDFFAGFGISRSY